MLCVTACGVSGVNRKISFCCNVPWSASLSEGASPCALSLPVPSSWGWRGQRVGNVVFYLEVRISQALTTLTIVKQVKVCCLGIRSSEFLFLPDLRDVSFGCCNPMVAWWLRAFDSPQPIAVPSAVFFLVLNEDFLQSSYLCSSLKWGEGASQIITRVISVMNEVVLIARKPRELVAQQYVCFTRLLFVAMVIKVCCCSCTVCCLFGKLSSTAIKSI